MNLDFKIGESVSMRDATSTGGKVVDIWVAKATENSYEILIGVDFGEEIPKGHDCRGTGTAQSCMYITYYKLERAGK